MESSKPGSRKSGLIETSIDEPKGALVELLKAAKKEEKLVLAEVRASLKKSRRARKLVKPYKTDVFGQSFGIRGHSRQKRFIKLINRSLQLAIIAKIHLPVIETVAKEVKEWLLSHKKDKTTLDLLPADEKIIDEVQRTKSLLETAIKNLTELDNMQWGSTSSGFSLFGMYYIPVERESKKMTGIKYRADWVKPLEESNDSLKSFEKAVEDIFKLQNEINKKYRP